MSKPAIVMASKFSMPSDEKFTEYINYIDRDEAVRTEQRLRFDLYADRYMDNEKKTSTKSSSIEKVSALFSDSADTLTMDQKEKLKKDFRQAQKAGSPMWQNVISFDNAFLEECSLWDSQTKTLDESKIRQATRNAMSKMLRLEKMTSSAVWSASIHYNTDNIHVHIAVVEPTPTRPMAYNKKTNQYERRGKLLQKSLDDMKLAVGNTLYDKKEQTKQINDIVRQNLIAGKRSHNSLEDAQLKEKFLSIYGNLSRGKGAWNYTSLSSKNKKELDDFSKEFISIHHKKDMIDLDQALDKEVSILKRLYGNSPKADEFRKNVIGDLNHRMGNSILKEMKQVAQSTLQHTSTQPQAKQVAQSTLQHTSTQPQAKQVAQSTLQHTSTQPQAKQVAQSTLQHTSTQPHVKQVVSMGNHGTRNDAFRQKIKQYVRKNNSVNTALYNLKRATKQDIEHTKNQIAYQQLERAISAEVEY